MRPLLVLALAATLLGASLGCGDNAKPGVEETSGDICIFGLFGCSEPTIVVCKGSGCSAPVKAGDPLGPYPSCDDPNYYGGANLWVHQFCPYPNGVSDKVDPIAHCEGTFPNSGNPSYYYNPVTYCDIISQQPDGNHRQHCVPNCASAVRLYNP
jgi:hypothetical protein